jgi:predicted ester cyclase
MKRLVPFVTLVAVLAVTGCGEDPVLQALKTADDNKAVVLRFANSINNQTYDSLRGVLAPNFVRHCQATPDVDIRSADAFVEFVQEQYRVFPDMRVNLKRMIAEGEIVAFWGTFSGTQEGAIGPLPPTGRRMELDIGGMFRVRGGLISELWITWDNMAGLAQVGLAPEPPAE